MSDEDRRMAKSGHLGNPGLCCGESSVFSRKDYIGRRRMHIYRPSTAQQGECDVILIRRFLGPWRQPAFPIWLLATLTGPWVGLDVAVPMDPKPCTRLLAESKNRIKPSVKRWLEAANHVIVLRHTEKGPNRRRPRACR